MKLLKRNQIIIYIFVLMLMTAGYLNFTANTKNKVNLAESLETSMKLESSDDMQIADIGDATLVSSEDVIASDDSLKKEKEKEDKEEKIEENIETKTEENKNENVSEDEVDIKTGNMKEGYEELNTEANAKITANNEYFIKSKLDREQMYSQIIETYENILNSTNSSETQKQSASEEIRKINETRNKIMICENLISLKGFENNVIFVNDKSINVIVSSDKLEKEETAQIQNIISREITTEVENIHITNK